MEQCLCPFSMFLLEGSSETGLFRHFFRQSPFLESVVSEIHRLWGSCVLSKYWKFNVDSRNVEKNPGKVFCFWEKTVWIGYVKLSLVLVMGSQYVNKTSSDFP